MGRRVRSVLRQEGRGRGVVWDLRGTATGDDQPAEEKLPSGMEKEAEGSCPSVGAEVSKNRDRRGAPKV